MQLIDQLGKEESKTPGRALRLYKFQGTCWEENATAHQGKSFLRPSEDRQSILILAPTAWIAHTFLKMHLPPMIPDRIICIGKVWLSPSIELDKGIPPKCESEE